MGFSFAAPVESNLKWSYEVAIVSEKYNREMYPSVPVDAWWASPDYNKKSGLLVKDVPLQYRHMHAMVVAALYAKRADQQEGALEWLSRYDCENSLACNDLLFFFEAAYKENVSVKKNRKKRQQLENVLNRIKSRSKSFSASAPPKSGLCAPQSVPEKWLEQEYALACPVSRKVPTGAVFCAGCKKNKDFEFNISSDSDQMLMSSSYLEGIDHHGAADCFGVWNVDISCGGSQRTTSTFQCKRTNEEYPISIECKKIKKGS